MYVGAFLSLFVCMCVLVFFLGDIYMFCSVILWNV